MVWRVAPLDASRITTSVPLVASVAMLEPSGLKVNTRPVVSSDLNGISFRTSVALLQIVRVGAVLIEPVEPVVMIFGCATSPVASDVALNVICVADGAIILKLPSVE